jgi:hypothetical protein
MAKIGMGDVKNYPLSDGDIRSILGDDISIITYPYLNKVNDISQIFDKKGRCILLFLTASPTAGHWCALLNKKKGITFFDPYGQPPETQKDGADPALLEQMGETRPRLLELLKASGKPVFYNTFPYQEDRNGVNSCGRWSVVRCLYAPKSDEYFNKVVLKARKKGMSGDDFVCGLTFPMIKK